MDAIGSRTHPRPCAHPHSDPPQPGKTSALGAPLAARSWHSSLEHVGSGSSDNDAIRLRFVRTPTSCSGCYYVIMGSGSRTMRARKEGLARSTGRSGLGNARNGRVSARVSTRFFFFFLLLSRHYANAINVREPPEMRRAALFRCCYCVLAGTGLVRDGMGWDGLGWAGMGWGMEDVRAAGASIRPLPGFSLCAES
ncbi:hypothetical protein C8Q76DRAFT_405577 [Earliella scabrosa]|nr:hypothetical protein C8Q76DRAFT_405577 [Earliella scabrosa]